MSVVTEVSVDFSHSRWSFRRWREILENTSGLMIGVGLIAEAGGKWISRADDVSHLLGHRFRLFAGLHLTMRVIVGIMLTMGYAAATPWIYRQVRQRPRHMQVFCGIAWLVALGTAVGANVYLWPPPLDPERYLAVEQAEWMTRVLIAHGTDGGVPITSLTNEARSQVWTTAQALAGVLSQQRPLTDYQLRRIQQAFDYIEKPGTRLTGTQEGWGYFEEWPWSVTEITAWVGLAEVAAIKRTDLRIAASGSDLRARIMRDVGVIVRSQNKTDGGWAPVSSQAPETTRTYSTAIATWFLIEASYVPELQDQMKPFSLNALRGMTWLLNAFQTSRVDGKMLGWVANPFRPGQRESFLGLNAQVLFILLRGKTVDDLHAAASHPNFNAALALVLSRSTSDVLDVSRNDRLHDSDRYLPRGAVPDIAASASVDEGPSCSCPFTIEGSTFLWYPWTFAVAQALSNDNNIDVSQRQIATTIKTDLTTRVGEAAEMAAVEMNYVNAELLIGTANTTHSSVSPIK